MTEQPKRKKKRLSFSLPQLETLDRRIFTKQAHEGFLYLINESEAKPKRKLTIAELDTLIEAVKAAHQSDLEKLESLRVKCVEKRLTREESGKAVGKREWLKES